MTDTLSARLRQETKQAHTRAERSGIMRALMAGRLEKSAYTALVGNLHRVYVALESGLTRHRGHPLIAPIYHEELFRRAALEQDLVTLAGPGWASTVARAGPSTEYAARIQAATDSAPWLLAAHAYTRYLGDLSGGQILRGMVQKQLGANGGDAIAFYEFPDIPDPDTFKRSYRAALDELPLTPEQSDQVVAESLAAFDLNARLFEAVA